MKEFRRILVDLDPQQRASTALARAAVLAREEDATVTVVAVAPSVPKQTSPWAGSFSGVLQSQTQEALAAAQQELREAGAKVDSKMLTGDHAVAVIREALQGRYDVLIRAHAKSGAYGPVDLKLVRQCPCPVWLVANAPLPRRRIVAAVGPEPDDQTEGALNRTIVDLALSLADLEDAELHLLHAWFLFAEDLLRPQLGREDFARCLRESQEAAQARLDHLLDPVRDRLGNAQIHLEKGTPADVVTNFVEARRADLLVMGTLAHSGLAGFIMGNTAEVVLQRVQCSLIAVKPADFVSPVTA